jgi:hypothetical protein
MPVVPDLAGSISRFARISAGARPASLTFMKALKKRHGTAEKTTTDGLRPYKAAMKELGAAHKQVVGRWANNRVENSRLPLRLAAMARSEEVDAQAQVKPWVARSSSTIPFRSRTVAASALLQRGLQLVDLGEVSLDLGNVPGRRGLDVLALAALGIRA